MLRSCQILTFAYIFLYGKQKENKKVEDGRIREEKGKIGRGDVAFHTS